MDMKTRKFTEYIIQITSVVGDVETITANGINNSNYKDMLDVYRDVKDDYKDLSCKIDFIGKNQDGQVKVLWSKNNINNEPTKKERSYQEIVKEFIDSIKEKEKQCNYEIKKLDKETSNTLHKIELVEFSDWGSNEKLNEEKIKLVDELIPILSQRRCIKEELKSIKQSESIVTMSKSICQSISDKEKIKNKKYTYEKIKEEKTNKIVEVAYKNDKDRIRITSALKRKYGTVNVDESRKIICAYVKRTGKKAV